MGRVGLPGVWEEAVASRADLLGILEMGSVEDEKENSAIWIGRVGLPGVRQLEDRWTLSEV
jgi:hypothetical protein